MWDEKLAIESRSLADWILAYFQDAFLVAEKPGHLTPHTHALLLNLRLQCAAIAALADEAFQRVQYMRRGLADCSYLQPEKVWLQYQPRKSLVFRLEFGQKWPVIGVPYIVAPWNLTFYYHLGQVFAYLLKKQRIPRAVEQEFQQAIRDNTTNSFPIAPTRSSDPELFALYCMLNQQYFNQTLPEVTIRWGVRPNKRKLGHWDELHKEIIINPLLKLPDVPHYVLRSIVYHEMLHIALPPVVKNGRILRHYREFREAEKCFPDFFRSQHWIHQNWARHYRRYHKKLRQLR